MTVPECMQALADDERLGRKNSRGFYRYDRRTRGVDESVYTLLSVVPDRVPPDGEIAERCVLQMVNEAVLCLDEGILRSSRDGDIGAVFGLGFPPFLGGPLCYADDVGPAHVVERLEHYRDRLSDTGGALRFEPAAGLRERARSGQRFHR